MSVIYRGAMVVKTEDRISWNINTGPHQYLTFAGTQAEIENLYGQYTANGATCEIKVGAPYTLTVDVYGEDPTYTWEILTEVKSIPIAQSVNFRGLSVSNQAEMIIWRKNIGLYGKESSSYANKGYLTGSFPNFTGSAAQIEMAERAMLLSIRGVGNITLFIPTLRVSYVVSTNYQITNATSYVDRVFSTAACISAENVPSRLWLAMPNSWSETYANTLYPPGGPASGSAPILPMTWNLGWLKGPAAVQHSGYSKITISQEYRYAAYTEEVYGTMITN